MLYSSIPLTYYFIFFAICVHAILYSSIDLYTLYLTHYIHILITNISYTLHILYPTILCTTMCEISTYTLRIIYLIHTIPYHTLYYTVYYSIDVEEITHKAGNYKKFDIFIKMLLSSLYKDTHTSNSVYIDLLTYADLELLKARKSVPGNVPEALNNSTIHDNTNTTANTNNNNTANNISIITKQHNKRYIILTYTSEFDRVHYPLPLQYNEVPETDNLIRTINRYRHRLKQSNVGKAVVSPGGGNISIQTNNE